MQAIFAQTLSYVGVMNSDPNGGKLWEISIALFLVGSGFSLKRSMMSDC